MDMKRSFGKGVTGNRSGPPNKKTRVQDEEEDPSAFEEELALMDEVENELAGDDVEMLVCMGSGPAYVSTSSKWSRPPVPPLNPKLDRIVFQQIDVDHYTGRHMPGMPGSTVGPVPIIRMFGVTMEGNSVLAHVHGFAPYFFVPAQPGFKEEHLGTFKDALNNTVLKDMRSNKEGINQTVLAVEMVSKESIYGYHSNRKVPFLKITMAIPRLIAPAKRLLEQGFQCPGYSQHGFQTYETNIDFEIRHLPL